MLKNETFPPLLGILHSNVQLIPCLVFHKYITKKHSVMAVVKSQTLTRLAIDQNLKYGAGHSCLTVAGACVSLPVNFSYTNIH